MLRPIPLIPDLQTELPGPLARALIEEDHRFTSPSYTRVYPLAVARAQGMIVEDVDGNRFLDFTAGIATNTTGHCHPRIVQAIQRQAETLLHMSGTDFYYPQQRDLSRRLAELVSADSPYRVFLTNSGTEAVEAALKLARYHTGRHQVIAFHGAFHGRTLGALSLTASKTRQRERFGPLLPGVIHVPYADPYRPPLRANAGTCVDAVLQYLEQQVFQHLVSPEEVAAVVVEPIQGEGGYIVPPEDFHPRLRALAHRHGILYVADEVQTGMGRTGKMFCLQHWGVTPDIVCLAKGIASGMPLGAMIAREDIMDWLPGAHASTFGGNPVSCAAAMETIAMLDESLIANAVQQGGYLRSLVDDLMERYPVIGDVRGMGLMIGIDIVQDRTTRLPDAELRDQLIADCFKRGLLLLGCGVSVIRICPPLIVDRPTCETAVAILDDAFAALTVGSRTDP